MEDKKYKVILQLKDDLRSDELDFINSYIEKWKKIYNIINIKDDIYCLSEKIAYKPNGFVSLAFFYANMTEKKDYMKKLEYYDFIDKEFDYAV